MTSYVDDKVKQLTIQLDDIEQQVGLKDIVHNVDVERFMSMSENDLDLLSPQECAQAKYILFQHSLTIQKKMNRAMAIRNWCERNLTVILAGIIDDIDKFANYELKREIAVRNNTFAERLKEISVEQQQIIDSLSFTTQAINNMAGSFQTLYNSKRKAEDHEYS